MGWILSSEAFKVHLLYGESMLRLEVLLEEDYTEAALRRVSSATQSHTHNKKRGLVVLNEKCDQRLELLRLASVLGINLCAC